MQHPHKDHYFSRAVGMKKEELDAFQPNCTAIRELTLGRQIFLGGHRAADSKQVLDWHGVKFKCCLARTYHVQSIEGIGEITSCSWNWFVKHKMHREALNWAQTILEKTMEYGSVLIYDQRGAHKSAAGAVLLVALTTKDWTVEQATRFVRLLRPIVYICAADSKFIAECLERARAGGPFLPEFQRESPYAVPFAEFRSQAG